MATPWILVSPANRGIGYSLTRHLLRTTSLPILATARLQHDTGEVKASLLGGLFASDSNESAKASQSHNSRHGNSLAGRLNVVHADVTDEATLEAAAAQAAKLFPQSTHHLRLACALPGILHAEKNLRQVSAADSLESFQVNSVGALLLMKHFADFLPSRAGPELLVGPDADADTVRLPGHATWLSMSARVGSTADNRLGGWYSYRASKAAVISLAKSLDLSLHVRSGDRAMAVSYHPGTVRTDFSREFWSGVADEKLFSPGYAAQRLVDVVAGLEIGQRGRCWDWKGEEVPP
ncbi:hypothetical protein EDB81DRAFT_940394 [Dactylonectria macrodidyma]|uniref:Uncharacterized protein n=1 Tax=Dactylonectria macrodidyma TaxID=307937 RepID=A0A9P9FU26_9HYPO|nr:hypothetical protein EDB81DRAFT_940394 [Dactylonectria macrodidyma]